MLSKDNDELFNKVKSLELELDEKENKPSGKGT